ncbi:uncharacterized protein B0T23DRAFT_420359 [Neurospora hispaniola]|uniref:Uncharacterized protein n=1 Tax=Neurospora hispaniola TaxID=588809 RepID=A0AAJ0I886_9PEZI|nr:hypothetical protein B0T23DRAFT_420359 [Neurospora hispaniola]
MGCYGGKHHVVPSTQQAVSAQCRLFELKSKSKATSIEKAGYIQTRGILGDSSFMKTSKLTWDSYDLPRLQAKLPILHIHLGGYHHEVKLVMRHGNAGFTILQRLSNDHPSVPFNPRYSH